MGQNETFDPLPISKHWYEAVSTAIVALAPVDTVEAHTDRRKLVQALCDVGAYETVAASQVATVNTDG